MVTGIVPLTSALIEDVREGMLHSLQPADVVPYLREKLHWRVTLVSAPYLVPFMYPTEGPTTAKKSEFQALERAPALRRIGYVKDRPC
jgi:hypothetical protein